MTRSKCDYIALLWPTCRTFCRNESRGRTSNRRIFQLSNVLKFYTCQICLCLLAPPSPSEKNFDAFSSLFRFFRSFLLHVQGVRAIVHVAMQVHAVQSRTATQTRHRSHLRSTCADLPAFAISKWFFPNDLRCGFRKLKEEGVGNRRSGAALVPKSLLLLLLLLLLSLLSGQKMP